MRYQEAAPVPGQRPLWHMHEKLLSREARDPHHLSRLRGKGCLTAEDRAVSVYGQGGLRQPVNWVLVAHRNPQVETAEKASQKGGREEEKHVGPGTYLAVQWVRPLVGKLKSPMPCGTVQKKARGPRSRRNDLERHVT